MNRVAVLSVAVVLLIAVAALLYRAADEGGRSDKLDAGLEEQIKKLAAEDQTAERPLDAVEVPAGSYEARVYFCRQALQRVLERGHALLEREVSSAATLISPHKLIQYYICKAAEDLDTRWCDKLKPLEGKGLAEMNPYDECIKQYKPLVAVEAFAQGLPEPSLDALDKRLSAKEFSMRDEVLKTARPILNRSPEGCKDLSALEENLACVMLTSPQDPPLPPDDADLGLRNFFYSFMALRHNDPSWLSRTADFDLFSIKGAFTSEPYCDAAFRQMADMFCVGSKQESFE